MRSEWKCPECGNTVLRNPLDAGMLCAHGPWHMVMMDLVTAAPLLAVMRDD